MADQRIPCIVNCKLTDQFFITSQPLCAGHINLNSTLSDTINSQERQVIMQQCVFFCC
jgi:hypothetical protein